MSISSTSAMDRSSSFGLTQRLVEHQTHCQGSLDRQCRIGSADRLAFRWQVQPLGDRLVVVNHTVSAPPSHQSRVIVRPVRHTIFRRGDFVAARLVELDAAWVPTSGYGTACHATVRASGSPIRPSRSLHVPLESRNDGQHPGIHAPTRGVSSSASLTPHQTTSD